MPINNEPLIVQNGLLDRLRAKRVRSTNRHGSAGWKIDLDAQMAADLIESLLADRVKATSEAIERAAEVADRRANVFRGRDGDCSFSLQEECEDIATAIRSLSIPGTSTIQETES